MPIITVTTDSGSKEHKAHTGRLLDELLLELGYLIERQCAGKGTCGRCVLRAEGELDTPTDDEVKILGKDRLDEGWRLACQARISGDVKIILPEDTPHTDKIFGKVPPAEALPESLGLAVDLGTTTVGVLLVDTDNGRVIAANAVLNRQATIGADVISRLEKALEDRRSPTKLAIDSITDALEGLVSSKKTLSRIKKVVVVGNTAMHHLLLGLDISRLMVTPFRPASEKPLVKKGIINELGAAVDWFFPPLIGGFVGSDALACMVYFGIGREDRGPTMAVDLGTNGEVMIGAEGRILVSSTAAGPAFEGVSISCGMRASPGAVVSARWENNALALETIGNIDPQGLAGSGLLSVVRRLRERGIIEPGGRIVDPEDDQTGLVFKTDDGKAVKLPGGLALIQDDIRELQKAKGAVRACAEILMKMAGVEPGKIERVFLTGSFGGRLDVEDVLSLGVLPPVDAPVISSIPNGAGLGAATMLDMKEFERAGELAARCEHIELFDSPAFMDTYIESMSLKS